MLWKTVGKTTIDFMIIRETSDKQHVDLIVRKETTDNNEVKAGEIFVSNTDKGSGEVLVVVSEVGEEGVFKAVVLRAAKKDTPKRLHAGGASQRFCLAQTDAEYEDDEVYGMGLCTEPLQQTRT